MGITKKAAEILVECGYVIPGMNGYMEPCFYVAGGRHPMEIVIDPFADTLEGRRQADAIEDWLMAETTLWCESFNVVPDSICSQHQWRLDRIKYCLEELSK